MELLCLPIELLHRICEACEPGSVQNLRLTARLVRDVANEHLLRKMIVHYNMESLNGAKTIGDRHRDLIKKLDTFCLQTEGIWHYYHGECDFNCYNKQTDAHECSGRYEDWLQGHFRRIEYAEDRFRDPLDAPDLPISFAVTYMPPEPESIHQDIFRRAVSSELLESMRKETDRLRSAIAFSKKARHVQGRTSTLGFTEQTSENLSQTLRVLQDELWHAEVCNLNSRDRFAWGNSGVYLSPGDHERFSGQFSELISENKAIVRDRLIQANLVSLFQASPRLKYVWVNAFDTLRPGGPDPNIGLNKYPFNVELGVDAFRQIASALREASKRVERLVFGGVDQSVVNVKRPSW